MVTRIVKELLQRFPKLASNVVQMKEIKSYLLTSPSDGFHTGFFLTAYPGKAARKGGVQILVGCRLDDIEQHIEAFERQEYERLVGSSCARIARLTFFGAPIIVENEKNSLPTAVCHDIQEQLHVCENENIDQIFDAIRRMELPIWARGPSPLDMARRALVCESVESKATFADAVARVLSILEMKAPAYMQDAKRFLDWLEASRCRAHQRTGE